MANFRWEANGLAFFAGPFSFSDDRHRHSLGGIVKHGRWSGAGGNFTWFGFAELFFALDEDGRDNYNCLAGYDIMRVPDFFLSGYLRSGFVVFWILALFRKRVEGWTVTLRLMKTLCLRD